MYLVQPHPHGDSLKTVRISPCSFDAYGYPLLIVNLQTVVFVGEDSVNVVIFVSEL